MKLRYCAVLTAVTLVLVLGDVAVMWAPWINLMQSLDFGCQSLPKTYAPAWWRVTLAPTTGALLVLLSLASLWFPIRGLRLGSRKLGWKILVVLGVLLVVLASYALVAAPGMASLYREYGVK